VLDTSHGQASGVPVSLADHTVLVASPQVEPALADLVSESLGRIGSPPLVVLNRSRESDGPERWADRARITVARSRLAAHLAMSGRHHPGALGEGIAELASLCDAVRSDW
jgi:hypothetical protein